MVEIFIRQPAEEILLAIPLSICPIATLMAGLLLLAMNFYLMGLLAVRASQTENCLANEGQNRWPTYQPRQAVETTLFTAYVQMEVLEKTWAPSSFSNPALPPSLRDLIAISLTTVCAAKQESFKCSCLPGHGWNASICHYHDPCHPCNCIIFYHPNTGYCQLLPPVPGNLIQNSSLHSPGSTLTLAMLLSHEATQLRWYLQPVRKWTPVLLKSGTQVSLSAQKDQAVLTITNVSQDWAGWYVCRFVSRGFLWELRQLVEVPLQADDVLQHPRQLSISCNAFSGFQLSCCFPSTNLTYAASWSPRHPPNSTALLPRTPETQCLTLVVPSCPENDTNYTCNLQSPGLDPVSTPISVSIIRDRDVTCPQDSLGGDWSVTKAGYVAQIPCPINRIGMVERHCGAKGIWGPINSNCTDVRLVAMFRTAQLLLAGQGEPKGEVPKLIAQLQKQVAAVSSPSDLLALLGTVKILAQVVTRASTELNRKTLKDFLMATNDLLELDPNSIWAPAQAQVPSMSSAMLQAVESLGRNLCYNDHPFTLTLPNVQLQTHLFGPMTQEDYSVSFSTHPPLRAKISHQTLAHLAWKTGHVSITSIVLSKLDRILPMNYGQGLRDLLYDTPGLILSNSITDGNQTVTKVEIIMDFGGTEGIPTCVFWDHTLFQGAGAWSKEGCETKVGDINGSTQCICVHLTSFSVLMSPHSVPNNPTLTLLTQVGLGASILALLLCLGVYRIVWKAVVRNKISYFRHVALLNVVLCLLAADTFFFGTSLLSLRTHNPLCLAITFLCHFFYLATFFWMLAQALMLAHQLLFVFHQLSKRYVLPIMFVLGYLCPLGIAGTTLVLYLPQGQYLQEDKCWLDGKGGAIYTFVGPVLVIVGINGLVLAMAVVKLLRPSLSEGPQSEKQQALLGVIKALFILMPIFGLTWVLGLATVMDRGNEIPHYLFTVLNTSQGIFILFFGCLMDKKVQEALFKHFCCILPAVSTVSLQATNGMSDLESSK
ncbi:adhesion G-protein coupled receptor F3 [Petaurus breviceps papuanus]|uniref:adhesion G-protein coupled receptor F3 n=1 Tax=Petaurus breviceps papuanus TaxID=3040969 RepID=UPI0036DA2A6D